LVTKNVPLTFMSCIRSKRFGSVCSVGVNEIADALLSANIRVEIDTSSDQISGQIKRAQLERVPWMFVLGKKEVENKTITLRDLDGKQEFGLKLDDLLSRAREEII